MSLFTLPPLATSLVSLFFVLLIFSRTEKSPTNRTFALMCLEFFNWQACWFASYFLTTDSHRYLIAKIAFVSIVFLPVTALHFVTHFLRRWQREAVAIRSLYAVSFIFFILLWKTNLVVSGYREFTWGIYGKAGSLHPLLVFFVAATLGRLLWILSTAVVKGKSQTIAIQHNQTKFTLVAFVLFSCAAVEFLINYGVGFYPIGSFFIIASFSFIFYAITRYRFMDIRVFAFRSVAFVIVYLFVLGIPFWIGAKTNHSFWFLPVLLMAVFATVGPFIYNYIRRSAETILLKEQRRYQATLLQVSQGMTLIKELDRLLRLIVHVVSRAVKTKHVSLFLLDKETDRYILKAVRYKNRISDGFSFDPGEPMIKHLIAHRAPIILEETRLRLAQSKASSFSDLKAIVFKMEELDIAVIVPSFVQDLLLGFLVLGEKPKGQAYSQDDLNVFSVLANQAALAIENAAFYQEQGKTLAERFHEHKVWSIGKMGAGVGHQINNCFNNVRSAVEVTLFVHLAKIKQALAQNGLQNLSSSVDKAEECLNAAVADSRRGGEIATTLTNFSRKSTDFKPVVVDEIVKGALNLLSCKFHVEELNLVCEIPPGTPKVFGILSVLQSIFMNMFDNAHDAHFDKKEKIAQGSLPAKGTYLPKIFIRTRQNADPNFLVIEIEDNGIGMTEEQLKQLYIPFFTTKATSEKGTGLGMSIIKQMIDLHKGTIKLTSKYGEGTTVTLALPKNRLFFA